VLPKKLGSCGEWFEDPAEPLISECLPRVITVNISIPDQNVNGNKLTTARFEAAGIAVGAAEFARATATFGTNVRSKDFFEKAIAAEWRKQVSSIIQTGKWLQQAKEELSSEDFAELKLPFSTRVCQMLRQIVGNLVLSDANYSSFLPPCWRTLVILTQLSDRFLKDAIADGRIHPKLKQKEARALVKFSPASTKTSNGNGEKSPESPDAVTIWGAFSPADKVAIFTSEGRAGLAKVMPAKLLADIADHAIRQQMVGTSVKGKAAATFTAILRLALDPTTADPSAVLERFTARLKSLGLDFRAISVAVKQQKKGK